MSQLNDCRFDALRAQGFEGHTNDMLLAWAQAGGATLGHINDALLQYLQLNGATSGSLSDAWFEALRAAGYEGARNDMEMMFWCAGGTFALTALRGWTGTEDCTVIDGTTVTVKFSKPVTFTEATLPNGVTITHDNGGAFTITASSGSGTDLVTYTGTWNVEPVFGDAALWDYDGIGDYSDNSDLVQRLNFVADSWIITTQTIPGTGNGFIEGNFKLDPSVIGSATQGILEVQGGSENIMIRYIGVSNSLNWRCLGVTDFTHPITLVGNVNYHFSMETGANDGDACTLTITPEGGAPVVGIEVRGGIGADPFKFGARNSNAIPINGSIWDIMIKDSSGVITNHWPIDDGVIDGGEITNIINPANHGTLTLGVNSSWESSGSTIPLEAQDLNLINCIDSPNNYQLYKPVLLSNFSIAPDDDTNNNYELDTEKVLFGQASARLNTNVIPAVIDFIIDPVRISEDQIALWVWRPSISESNVTGFVLFLADDAGAFGVNHWASVTLVPNNGPYENTGGDQRSGWSFVTANIDDFAPSGTFDIRNADIDTVRLRISSGSGYFIFDSIHANARSRPKVLFMMDDAHQTAVVEGKAMLDTANMKFTVYQTRTLIDDGDFATTQQLHDIYDEGNDVCNHLRVHTSVAAFINNIAKGIQTVITTADGAGNNNRHLYEVGNEMLVHSVSGMPEINGLHVITNVTDFTVTFNVDSTGFGDFIYDGLAVVRYSDAQMANELQEMETWLQAEGMTRGLKHYAAPTGFMEIDIDPLLYESLGFKTSRAIQSTLTNDHVLGVINHQQLWSKGVGINITVQNMIDNIDKAIDEGGWAGVYIHGLTDGIIQPENDYYWHFDKFQEVIDHVKTRVDAGDVDVVTITEWYEGLNDAYNLKYFP